MKVIIEVTGWFKRYTEGNSRLEFDVELGSTVIDVVNMSGIPGGEIGFIALENERTNTERRLVDNEFTLHEDDVIRVFPKIIGG